MITIQQLKDLVNSIEAKAKLETNLGIKSGMYTAVADIWTFISDQVAQKQS